MDAAGLDLHVLSHQSPGSQRLSDDVAAVAGRRVNDALAGIIAEAPVRFPGFAIVPTSFTGQQWTSFSGRLRIWVSKERRSTGSAVAGLSMTKSSGCGESIWMRT